VVDPAAVAQAHAALTGLAADGVVVPLVGGTLPLSDVPAGLQRLAAGDTIGRLVVTGDG
jgi:NADPH:quinone reductase